MNRLIFSYLLFSSFVVYGQTDVLNHGYFDGATLNEATGGVFQNENAYNQIPAFSAPSTMPRLHGIDKKIDENHFKSKENETDN